MVGHFAITASKIKIAEAMMPNIQPFANDRNKPRIPNSIRKMRSAENWDFFLIGAPHLGHVEAVVETAF
jgi:hypothetical protein